MKQGACSSQSHLNHYSKKQHVICVNDSVNTFGVLTTVQGAEMFGGTDPIKLPVWWPEAAEAAIDQIAQNGREKHLLKSIVVAYMLLLLSLILIINMWWGAGLCLAVLWLSIRDPGLQPYPGPNSAAPGKWLALFPSGFHALPSANQGPSLGHC